MMTNDLNAAPLAGLTVLDLTRWLAGPYCTMLLADAGAEVIKIEPLEGEINRVLEPIVVEENAEPLSAYFMRLNRRKKSVTLDLRDKNDHASFLEMVRSADVVVENFRPGVMDKLGLGQELLRQINPQLVVCSISGFGASESDLRTWPSFNLVAEAMSGLVRINEETDEPQALGPAIGDLGPALHALSGILMALLRRNLTGVGSFVDIAMFDSCLSLNELAIATSTIAGETFEYGRRINPNLAPYGLFPTADGHVCIAVASDPQWLDFCRAINDQELLADTDLHTGAGRVEHFDQRIVPVMNRWLKTRTREEAASELASAGVPAAPVWRSNEALNTRQARQRDMAEMVIAPDGRQWPIPASPIRLVPGFDNGPATTPQIGADNARFLARTSD